MNPATIKRVRQTKRIKLSFHQWLVYNLSLLPLLLISVILIFIISQFDESGSYRTFSYAEGLIQFAPAFVVLFLIIYDFRRSLLKMTEIRLKISNKELNQVIDYMVTAYDWQIKTHTKSLIIVNHHGPKTLGFMEVITVVKSTNSLLINSLNQQGRKANLISFGRNKKNISNFVKSLEKLCQNKPSIKVDGWEPLAPTLVSWLSRIVAYLICLGSVGLAFFLFTLRDGWITWLVAWCILAFISFVSYTDWSYAWQRRRAYKLYGKQIFDIG